MSQRPRVHKATPQNERLGVSTCEFCGEQVKRVMGGQGSTWIHTETGAVAGFGGLPSIGSIVTWRSSPTRYRVTAHGCATSMANCPHGHLATSVIQLDKRGEAAYSGTQCFNGSELHEIEEST